MRLFYRSLGEGIPVIILHGLFGSSDNWIPIARKISVKYRVIVVDLRNHGLSPHSDVHTYQSMVSDLVELFTTLSIDCAHIMSHSMGGKVAIKFAAEYPERVISLTVADILPKNYLENQISTFKSDFHNVVFETIEKIDLQSFKTRKEIETEIGKIVSDKQIASSILKNIKRCGKSFEWKINVNVLKSQLNHLMNEIKFDDFDNCIPITSFPILFIRGSVSNYITDTDFIKVKKIFPESKLETIDGATHWIHIEKTEEFSILFMNFLNDFTKIYRNII
jgi:esterase